MNRKEFLKSCACGLCTCAAASLFSPAALPAAEAATPQDWRLQFINKQYTKLLELLSDRIDKKVFNEILVELGRNCSNSIPWLKQYRNDPDGYFKELKKWTNEDATYDREKGIITITSAEQTTCGCPLIGQGRPPAIVCNCSLGNQQQTFETVLGKKVRVEIKESVLRGGKHCTFEIHVGKEV